MRKLVLVLTLGLLAGCDTGIQHMGATEYGVRFVNLPRILGGGVAGPGRVARPLETVVVWPWEDLYRFDASVQYLSSVKEIPAEESTEGEAAAKPVVTQENIHMRARDGNEAALTTRVRYRISKDPEQLVKMAQEVATSGEGVRQLVVAVTRSEIRANMNRLRTSEFRDDKKRNETIDQAQNASNKRLEPWGIEIDSITLDQYRFSRILPDGKEVSSYQDRLRDIQELEQDIEGERSRIETVRAQKQKELLEAESLYNNKIAEAKGYKEQQQYAGDSFYAARSNDAEAILAEGRAQAQGLGEQVAALSGAGGANLLKLEMAKQLMKSNPKFFALAEGQGGAQGIDVRRTDVNQLLGQLGLIEGLAKEPAQKPADAAVPPLANAPTN